MANLTEEEVKYVKEANYYASLMSSPGWAKLKQHMDAMVQEALDDMARLGPKSLPEERLLAHMRWQQRGSFRDTLIAHMATVVEVRNELLSRREEDYEFTYDTAYPS